MRSTLPCLFAASLLLLTACDTVKNSIGIEDDAKQPNIETPSASASDATADAGNELMVTSRMIAALQIAEERNLLTRAERKEFTWRVAQLVNQQFESESTVPNEEMLRKSDAMSQALAKQYKAEDCKGCDSLAQAELNRSRKLYAQPFSAEKLVENDLKMIGQLHAGAGVLKACTNEKSAPYLQALKDVRGFFTKIKLIDTPTAAKLEGITTQYAATKDCSSLQAQQLQGLAAYRIPAFVDNIRFLIETKEAQKTAKK